MTRNFHGRLLWAIALLAATVVACGGEPAQPPTSPVATPTPVATAAAPAATPDPTATATPSPSPTTVPAAATPSPSPTLAPTTTPTPAPSDPDATTFRYDTYDTTGAVATAGSYAFLADADGPSWAVTTYQGLRDGTATALLIHTSDADGVSRAALYDTVEVGDLFEWRQADDCFVRYRVTEVKPDPGGTVPRKLLAVEGMTYAFTGCSGTVSIGDSAIMTWGELADLGGTNLRFPVVHGPFQLAPEGWVGTVEAERSYDPPVYSLNNPVSTSDAIVARSLPYWREPTLPAGWMFSSANSGEVSGPIYGYCALFTTADGYAGVEVCGFYRTSSRAVTQSSRAQGRIAYETRVLAGRPGWVRYSPQGPEHNDILSIRVAIYDGDTQSMYLILGRDGSLLGANVDAVIAIAESLFTDAPSDPDATTFQYDTYDTTGAVDVPGSYAFLAVADDPSTVVTTYGGLRDGTATALLIHTSDADGVSREGIYDGVEVGDLFEWRQADDCFVRYTVTEVKPDPEGTVPRKLLAVEWMTYAFTGCTGTIAADMEAKVDWGELPNLGGTSLIAPVIHGVYQIVPAGWAGATKALEVHEPPFYSGENNTKDITIARSLDYWREPTVPEGWVLGEATSGGSAGPSPGYCATYLTEERSHNGISQRSPAIEICGYFAHTRFDRDDASWHNGAYVGETRIVAGRPAYVTYSLPGPNHNELFPVTVWIFDALTGTEYRLQGVDPSLRGGPADPLIAIAESLFAEPPPVAP